MRRLVKELELELRRKFSAENETIEATHSPGRRCLKRLCWVGSGQDRTLTNGSKGRGEGQRPGTDKSSRNALEGGTR